MKRHTYGAIVLLLSHSVAFASVKGEDAQGPRELGIAGTIESFQLSNQQLAQLPHVRDAFIANMQDVGSSTIVNGSLYTIGQVVAEVPVAGGMVKDGIDKLHRGMGDDLREQYESMFDLAMKKLIYNDPSQYKSLKDQLFPTSGAGTIDVAAADAFVNKLISSTDDSYAKLPTDLKVEFQRQSIEYLARNFDKLQGVTREVVAELNKQRSKVRRLSSKYMEMEGKLSLLGKQQAKASADLKKDGDDAEVSVEKGDTKNAELSRRQLLIDLSAQAAVAKDQLDALASGLHKFGLDKEARIASKAAQACAFLATAAQVGAGNYLAILPAFSAFGGLFGSTEPDPVLVAAQQILAKLDEIERKIDLYHQEDLARFTRLEAQLNEVLRTQKYMAQGTAQQCEPWIKNGNSVSSSLVTIGSTVRVPEAVNEFDLFYELRYSQVGDLFLSSTGESCLSGLMDLLVSQQTNPGLFLDAVDSSGTLPPADKRVAYYWDRTQGVARLFLKPEAMSSYLATPAFGGGSAGSGNFTKLGQEYFAKDPQLYNLANVVTYASYAAAVHGFYAYIDRSRGVIRSEPNISGDGELLIKYALAHVESAIAQLRMLSEGPLLQIAYKYSTGELDQFAMTPECSNIISDCKALDSPQGKQIIGDLIEQSPWLEHNLGLMLLKKSIGAFDSSQYRFIYGVTTRMKSADLLKRNFQTAFPAGYDVKFDDQDDAFHIVYGSSGTRLASPDELDSEEFAYPMTMLEAVRVEQQLLLELGGYAFRDHYPDKASYVRFAKGKVLLPR